MEKIVKVRLPYDLKEQGYGIAGLMLWYILKGELGAVQYAVYIPYYLPHIDNTSGKLMGVDVGYHSLVPMYEDQTSYECDMFGKCYYDGSGLRADDWTKEIFATKGKLLENVIWEKLTEEYELRFGEKNN